MVFLPSSTESRRGHTTMKTKQISYAHAPYGKTTSGRPSCSLPSWILRSLFQHDNGLGYYSNMTTARLLFQHGVGLARALSFEPTNYEQCLHLSGRVSDTFSYRIPLKKLVSTLHVSTSLKSVSRKCHQRFHATVSCFTEG